MATTETLIVLESFVGRVNSKDKEARLFLQGETVRSTDPAVKKWPQFFGQPRFAHDNIEQATAAPGEKR